MGVSGWVSRRRFLRSAVALATAWKLQRAARALGLADGAAVCNVAAEQEVGPYYVASELLRSDIREGKPGLPLVLRLMVLNARSCKPLQNAAIDVWHCDALGVYSGFTKVEPMGFGPGGPPNFDPAHGPPGPPQGFDPQHPERRPGPPEGMGAPPEMHTTDEMSFLRGIQFTDAHGAATFATVFPGFYMGRTNHIHFKVREDGHVGPRKAGGRTYTAGHTAHVGQVFFPEEFAAELMRHQPYAGHSIHRTTQAEDMIFQGQHGAASVAKLKPVDPRRPEAGYTAELIVAVDPTATPKPVQGGFPGGPGGPPGGSGRPQGD